MDLALLRTFITVHRAGSFTRAAALLGLSQPAVTSQIRTLERQLGRPLFLRQARGVTPTTVGDELAHRAAPHLDALVEIVEEGLEESGVRTLHLAGPPEFTSTRVLPALAPLVSQGLALRTSFTGNAEETLEGLAAGHHDLAVTTARPRGGLLATTPLWDEEHVLVASPGRAVRLGDGALGCKGAVALEQLPVVEVHESLPFVSRYWSSVFDSRPPAVAAVIAPDLRAALESAAAGAGLAVLPRYLCLDALESGRLVALLDPPVPPLRTYFLVVRTGTLALTHLARAHEELLRASAAW